MDSVTNVNHSFANVLNVPFAEGNPYHHMLYDLPTNDAQFNIGKRNLTDLNAFATRHNFPILHLHWDDRIFGREDDKSQNMSVAKDILQRLVNFKSDGGKVLWTIHNRQPHNQLDPETFRWARQQLCDIVDLIHVHAVHAAQHMINAWGVQPEKLQIIRHPSYLGAYEPAETTLTRPLPKLDKRRFVFAGQMRQRKGLPILQEVMVRLAKQSDSFELIMVGKPVKRQLRRLEALPKIDGVTIRPERVPDAELVQILGSSQVGLAPFDDVFTSGSIILKQTFGLPVIAPDRPEVRELTPKGCWDLLYGDQRPRPIVQMMKRVIAMPDDELAERRQMCFEFAKSVSPAVIGPHMKRVLRSLERQP